LQKQKYTDDRKLGQRLKIPYGKGLLKARQTTHTDDYGHYLSALFQLQTFKTKL